MLFRKNIITLSKIKLMTLKEFSYSEFDSKSPRHWELENFALNNINLFVGDNASGKSRTLKYIFLLSRILLSSKYHLISGNYIAIFEDEGKKLTYELSFKDGKIELEKFYSEESIFVNRSNTGEGEIYNALLKQNVKFRIPEEELISTRRDELQFPFLEKLFKWASNIRHFRFSKEEEKQRLILIESNRPVTSGHNQNNLANQAIEVFRNGKAKYKEEFINKIIADFNIIGYDIKNIDFGTLHSIQIDSPIANRVVGLRVFEQDRQGTTDQNEMSDGMFRALSLIIHYNYYQLTKQSLTVLVDDIGEGLDYARSTKLIKLLIEKSLDSNIQLIMSSNDKFVLNNTDLRYWQVVNRIGNQVKIYNFNNSKEKFENFKFTGLNNFDFYISDFCNEDFE